MIAIELLVSGWIYLSIKHVKRYNQQISFGNKYLEELDYESAELCYKKAIEIDEKRGVPYLQLAAIYQDTNRTDEAEKILEKAESQKVFSKKEEEYAEELSREIQLNKKNSNTQDIEKTSKETEEKLVKRDEYLKQYQIILDEYNKAAEYTFEGFSVVSEQYPHVDSGYINFLSKAEYFLYDIDGNGVEEMAITWKNGSNHIIFDIYGYNGKSAEKLIFKGNTGWGSDAFIYTDGTIYVYQTFMGRRQGNIDFYRLGNDGYTLESQESYEMDSYQNPDTPYFNDTEKLTEEQFQKKLMEYTEVVPEVYIPLHTPIYTEKKKEENSQLKFYNEPDYPPYPEGKNQKYYIIFKEKYREDRVEMSIFDIQKPYEDEYIIWNDYLELNHHEKMLDCDQFFIENNKWVEFYSDYSRMSDGATEIISSNLDVYDSEGRLIMNSSKSKSTYEVFDINMTWNEAENYCKERGGHLVTITSEEEQRKVYGLIKDGDYDAYWMGASVIGAKWSWVTDEPFDYQLWAVGEPDESEEGMCLQMYLENGNWDDTWVDGDHAEGIKSHGFICEYEN